MSALVKEIREECARQKQGKVVCGAAFRVALSLIEAHGQVREGKMKELARACVALAKVKAQVGLAFHRACVAAAVPANCRLDFAFRFERKEQKLAMIAEVSGNGVRCLLNSTQLLHIAQREEGTPLADDGLFAMAFSHMYRKSLGQTSPDMGILHTYLYNEGMALEQPLKVSKTEVGGAKILLDRKEAMVWKIKQGTGGKGGGLGPAVQQNGGYVYVIASHDLLMFITGDLSRMISLSYNQMFQNPHVVDFLAKIPRKGQMPAEDVIKLEPHTQLDALKEAAKALESMDAQPPAKLARQDALEMK